MNDEEGLKEKLNEFCWPEDLPFLQSQSVTAEEEIAVQDIDDDLERELTFYNQARQATCIQFSFLRRQLGQQSVGFVN